MIANGNGVGLNGGDHLLGGIAPGAGNLISGNAGIGISVAETVAPVRVEGNYIGTNVAGTAALANNIGVYLGGVTAEIVIGGSSVAARNLISGNLNTGLIVSSGACNRVEGNYIGTDAAGLAAIANGTGVFLYASQSGAVIDNLVSGNGNGGGIYLQNVGNSIIQGNIVGATAAGDAALPNQGRGIFLIAGDHDNLIGGSAPGQGNLISGNLETHLDGLPGQP